MKALIKEFINTGTGETDRELYKVVDQEFVLNKNFIAQSFYKSSETLVNGVESAPHNCVLPSWWYDLKDIPIKRREKIDLDTFIQKFVERLSEYIYGIWNPKAHHIILHSSGWDSRILSSIILDLYNKLGDEWLGDVMFVCWGEEAKSFYNIMSVEGWSDNQYIAFSKLNKEYLEYHLDFDNVWRRLNGTSNYPSSHFYWVLDMLRDKEMISNNLEGVELWAASYFNEMFAAMENKWVNSKIAIRTKLILRLLSKYSPRIDTIPKFIDMYYHSRYADFSSVLPCPLIQPLLNFDSLQLITQSKIRYPKDIRMRIVKYTNPDILNIPSLTDTIVQVPGNVGDRLKKQYKESWYGKQNKIRVYTDKITPSPWWAHWSAASFCEYLHNR